MSVFILYHGFSWNSIKRTKAIWDSWLCCLCRTIICQLVVKGLISPLLYLFLWDVLLMSISREVSQIAPVSPCCSYPFDFLLIPTYLKTSKIILTTKSKLLKTKLKVQFKTLKPVIGFKFLQCGWAERNVLPIFKCKTRQWSEYNFL